MQSVSEFVIYGVIEALAIMLLVLILLVTYNFRLRGRIKTLDGWLEQLKDKTQQLIENAQANEGESGLTMHIVRNVWPSFVKAALGLLAGDARTHRASFVNTLEELNQSLDFPELEIPPRVPGELAHEEDATPSAKKTKNPSNVDDAAPSPAKGNTAGGVDLGSLKTVADEQKELIAMLLRQQTDSESAINIKVSELESLQRFNRESEVCVSLMEDELDTANTEIKALQAQVADVGDMKALIRRFTEESSEMLTIIDGMEHEIASLQAQLKN
ncbi:MAG: hypothetical protein ACI9SB_001495 [Candidatus Azotimanducaceae bacterium]|jgi:hypothetical protein